MFCACPIKEAMTMTEIRLPAPSCPLCGGSMSLIERRMRTGDKVVDIYKCDDCSVHFPRAVEAPVSPAVEPPKVPAAEPPKVIEP
jgi:transposase-like protein